ncbi:MAG TPA: Hpt domain-containing protein, partial [Burkholderiales bacterium]
MSASATILSWITAEVDQALTRVREQIARYAADPGDTAVLTPCPEHLHQVSGALRMVGLAGATRFCEEIEGGLAGLGGVRPSSQSLGVIDKAVLALKEFVDGLERGQANVPLRLFPVYRELRTLQGKPEAAEKDLFYPDLTLPAPAHAGASAVPAAELPAYLQAQRAQFQRGLLATLRNQAAGLEQMRGVLAALHQVSAQLPEPRSLWWAAEGLLDGFAAPPDAEWVARAKALCNKLDFQMRDLAAGAQSVSEALLRDVLYAIAKCKPATARLREIKQLYQLDGQFPDAEGSGVMEYDMDWLEPALADLRARLEALKSMWVQYVSGEPKSAARFRELVASFRSKAAEVGSAPLVKLLDAIALVSARLPDPYPQDGHAMVIEMASAFLLAESLIESFTEPAADADAQIDIMGGWLLDAAQGKSKGEPPPGLRADLSERIGAIRLRAQVAREIVANLQHVEKVLDGFVRDPSTRDSLPGLATHLRQMHGALTVLDFGDAARVVAICEDLIARCAQPGYAGTGEDMDWIAEGLSSLGFFLDPCLNGREPSAQAIELFFRRFDKAHMPLEQRELDATVVLTATSLKAADEAEAAVAAAMAAAAAAPRAKAPPARPEVNRELLDIYLEEASEVLAGIDASLPACRAEPQDRDALTTIRRGFHTLKGSGRMVGLMDLGEVAWEIEQVLNLWLEQKWPASPDLLDLIALGSRSFAGWVAQLREGSLTQEIEATALVDFAARLKQVETPAPVTVPAAPAAPAAEPAPEVLPTPAVAAEPLAAAAAAEPVLDFILRGQTGPMAAIVQEPAPQPVPPAERTTPPPPPDVQVGEIRVAPHLFDIYMKEAHQHLAALEAHAGTWRATPGTDASAEFVRAAHTLASSSRTAGFEPIAALAGALEQWTPHARLTTAPGDVASVVAAVEGLRERLEAVARREPPAPADEPEAAVRAVIARLLTPLPRKAPARAVPAGDGQGGREQRILRDDIDAQLLPVFLEEAQQLLPQIGADLRDWKANPGDAQVSRSLQRALHTLKGSARMAGAIRLGELTHLMESSIEAALEAGVLDASLFGDLEQKLDRLSLDLERMQYAPEVAPAAPAEAPRAEAPLPSPAAMLRVNADVLDQLINESGEVSIARTRVEAELRAVKQSIADLSDSIARLRSQLREFEVQADSQMQSRLSVIEERDRDFDPLEF